MNGVSPFWREYKYSVLGKIGSWCYVDYYDQKREVVWSSFKRWHDKFSKVRWSLVLIFWSSFKQQDKNVKIGKMERTWVAALITWINIQLKYPCAVLTHLPPLTHGSLRHLSTSEEQTESLKPSGHWQTKYPTLSTQCPPFWHGADRQSSMSTSHNAPDNDWNFN